MGWRTGLVLLIALCLTLFTSAGQVPRPDPPAVSITFLDAPAPDAAP